MKGSAKGAATSKAIADAFAANVLPIIREIRAAGITTKGENYRAPLAAELERIPPERRPQVRFITDPADYVKPDVLTFPLELEPPRLTRRCIGAGRLRVRLAGDVADVKAVAVRVGRRPARRATTAPFEVTVPRRDVARRDRGQLTATVTNADGSTLSLRRRMPGCGVRAGRA